MKESKKVGWGTALKQKIKVRYEEEKKKGKEEQQMKTRAQKKGREEALKTREKELERHYKDKQLNRMRPAGFTPLKEAKVRKPTKKGKKGVKKTVRTYQKKVKVKQQRPARETSDSLKDLYDHMT